MKSTAHKNILVEKILYCLDATLQNEKHFLKLKPSGLQKVLNAFESLETEKF